MLQKQRRERQTPPAALVDARGRPLTPPRGKPFPPGTSGNPSSRPKGTRNRATVIAQSLLDGDAEELVARAIDLAKSGDGVALRLCIERLVPRKRSGSSVVEIDLPRVRKAEDLAEAAAAVIDAAAKGELSMDEAHRWMELLQAQRAVIETADLAVRLELLEQQQRERAKRRRG